MKKRVAIIGFGNDAKHYYNELRRSEHFELAAIFDGVQNSEICGRIPVYDNINDLWIDPYDYNKQLVEAIEILSSRGLRASVYNAQLCVLPESIRETAVQSISEWKDIYLEECNGCKLLSQCGGFFASNKKYNSAHIKRM